MNYYSKSPAKLIILEGDKYEVDEDELLGIWPAIAKAAAAVGKFAVGGISKRIRRKRKKRAASKRRAAAKRKARIKIEKEKMDNLRMAMMIQAKRKEQRKKRQQKQFMNIAIPAAGIGAAMLFMGKDY